MSIAMSTKINADSVIAALEAKGRRLSDVVTYAMNDTVNDMVVSERVEMRKVFDNPRPYTLNALFPIHAGRYNRMLGRKNTMIEAGIAFREVGAKGTPAYKYLMPHIKGTPRNLKRSESALRNRLGVLGGESFTVQGRNFEKDQYGDIPGGQYTRMLAELGVVSIGLAGSKAQRKARRKGDSQFDLMYRKDGRPFAVAEFRAGTPVIMLVFTAAPKYKKRYDFYGVARRQVQESLPKHFNRIFSRMMGGGGSISMPMRKVA